MVVLLPSLLAACDEPPPMTDIVTGVSQRLAHWRAATISDVRYRFSLQIPPERDQGISGSAEIRFHWHDAETRDLVVDFKDPEGRVHEVLANGSRVVLVYRADHLVIPASALKSNAVNRLNLSITVGDDALNRNDGFLYTLFVPDRAHFSLPVFDQPDLKGRVTWELTLPRHWSALGNAPALSRSRVRQSGDASAVERDRILFAESDSLPTYLFAVAAGEFDSVRAERNGRVMEMLHRETDAAKLARNVDEIFDLHASALEWLEAYTGIKYPFQSFGFVLVPSFQYGGMEHPGAITYRASSLLLEENATEVDLLSRASLIAHETAHMWFGDLVTMAWFDDVWTKEVFANFMAAKIVHPSFPGVDHDLRFLLAHHPAAYAVDRTRGANAIRQPLENLAQAGTLYGAIIYQKAPVVMKQLERLLGEDAFRDGMRTYLSRYAYGNATWTDLVDILDGLHASDLGAWSDVWVEQPGRPTISVERRERPGDEVIVIRQSDPSSRGRVWSQRLDLAFFSGNDTDSIEPIHEVAVDLIEHGLEIPLPSATGEAVPRYVIPNAGGAEYGLFQPDPGSLAFLVDHGRRFADPLLRGTAWLTLWDAMLEGHIQPQTLLSAGEELIRVEPAEQLLSRALADIKETYWRFLDERQRWSWAARLETALWSAMEASETRTRRSALFAAYVRTASTPEAVARLGRLWSGEEAAPGLTLSQEDRIALARTLAVNEAQGWDEILATQASEIDNPDRLAKFLFLRDSIDEDPVVRRAFFESLRDSANRRREPWVLEGLRYLHHPLRSTSSVEFVLPALEMVEEIQRTGDIFFPAGWVAATLGGHNTPEVVDIVDSFLIDRPDYPPRLAQKILQASDMVERAARTVTAGRERSGRIASV